MAYENFFYEPGIFQLFSTIRNFREWGFQKHFVRRNFWEFTWKFAKFCEFAKIYSRNNLLKVARIHIDNPMYLTNNLTTLFKTVTIVISLIIQHALNRFLTNHKALFKCSKTFETSLSNHDKLISTHCVECPYLEFSWFIFSRIFGLNTIKCRLGKLTIRTHFVRWQLWS